MKSAIRFALAAFLLASAAPALAGGDCANCANCPKHAAQKATTADAQAPAADKKPEGEKPKCECVKGKDCACAKGECKCAQKAEPKKA